MEMAEFWKLIDEARTASTDSADEKEDFLSHLDDNLSELEEAEVASFHTHLFTQFARTFDWDVVAAAVVIYGLECDDLDIDGLRAWLVSRGEAFLDQTLKNVDSLAEQDLIPDELYWVELLNLPAEVYENLTGDELPADFTPAMPETPTGKEFQVKDLIDRLPKLADDQAFFLPSLEPVEEDTIEETDEDDFDALMADVSDDENPYSET